MVPAGEEIFRTSAFQDLGFTRVSWKQAADNDEVEMLQVLDHQEGVCAALTALWMRKTLEQGDLTSTRHINDHMYVAMSQAAYEFGSFSATRLGSGGREPRERLLEANNLKVISNQWDTFNKPHLKFLLREIVFDFGCYYLSMWEPPRGGVIGSAHAIGLKTGGTGLFLFDANQGLYKTKNPHAFVNGNTDFLYAAYHEFKNGRIHYCTCQLDGG